MPVCAGLAAGLTPRPNAHAGRQSGEHHPRDLYAGDSVLKHKGPGPLAGNNTLDGPLDKPLPWRFSRKWPTVTIHIDEGVRQKDSIGLRRRPQDMRYRMANRL